MIMDGNFYIGTCAIDLTYKCTFRCLHCFNSSGEHSLNKQEFISIMEIEIDNV